MRIALIAPPFIPVPPQNYGGTELFVAQLALGLKDKGIEVIVYTNGESTVPVERRWLYPDSEWPLKGDVYDNLRDLNHSAWAVRDAIEACDLVHINNLPGLVPSRFTLVPFVYTIHHPHTPQLTDFYSYYPDVYYVTISDFQRVREVMPRIRTIHHGLDLSQYRVVEKKEDYLSFIGRLAPIKGPHIAIQVAKQAGIPLKLAGEVQPINRDYFEAEIKPHLDGRFIEYIGEADLAAKNELLGKSRAMLFPIQWDEPFGLVMIEAMACGTPVLAFPGGSVPEIVADGVSGYVCASIENMVRHARELNIPPALPRAHVEQHFSVEHMVDQYVDTYEQALIGPLAADTGAADTDEEELRPVA